MIEFLTIGWAAAILLVLGKSRWNYIKLPELPRAAGAAAPDLTVIIPARNEARQIARAVRSFAGLPVIVVDDASTDETAAVARQAGATVITAPPLPAGAKGKPNACAAGARQAATKWILFVDADTWFEPEFAASLAAYAESEKAPFVTAFPEQVCRTPMEHALLPYAFALYFTGVSAQAVNSVRSKEALANGQCMLFERAAYERLGGHGAVITSVIEDVALARHAKEKGVTVRVIRAEALGHVRMYDSFGAIWRGFQKNSFRFLTVNPWSGVQVVAASILLTSWLPVAALGFADSLFTVPPPLCLLLAAPFAGLLAWYRGWRVLLAPLGIYGFQLIALNGMLTALLRRPVKWKDRNV